MPYFYNFLLWHNFKCSLQKCCKNKTKRILIYSLPRFINTCDSSVLSDVCMHIHAFGINHLRVSWRNQCIFLRKRTLILCITTVQLSKLGNLTLMQFTVHNLYSNFIGCPINVLYRLFSLGPIKSQVHLFLTIFNLLSFGTVSHCFVCVFLALDIFEEYKPVILYNVL